MLTPDQIDDLLRVDSPTVANAIETFEVRPRAAGYIGMDIRCQFPDLAPMLGYAVTCTVDSTTEGREGIGFDALYELLARAPKPAVVVMKDVGNDIAHSCHAGEVMSTRMKSLGAVGILTDGGLRDVREVRQLGGFHYFCPGLVVSHRNPICVSVGDDVEISGMTVRMGDLLHGDGNGVVHIPEECAADVVSAAQEIWRAEGEVMRGFTDTWTAGAGEIVH